MDRNKETFEKITCLIAIIFMGFIILAVALDNSNKIIIQDPAQPDYIQDFFYPDANQLIFEIGDPSRDVVREYSLKIDKEMDIISTFIRKSNNRVPLFLADKFAHSIIRYSNKNDLPHELVLGIIEVESFYDPSALGPRVGRKKRRARGLMQVLDKEVNGKKISKDKLHNIDYNIEKGIEILLSKVVKTKGDLDKSLFYYVGEDETYANKVYGVMGRFRFFRSQVLKT